MMKAALIHKYGQKELSIEEVPLPTIHDNDVLVKIIAASINPIDLKTKDGKVKMLLNYQMPLILGSDFAGIVVSVGKNVQNFVSDSQSLYLLPTLEPILYFYYSLWWQRKRPLVLLIESQWFQSLLNLLESGLSGLAVHS